MWGNGEGSGRLLRNGAQRIEEVNTAGRKKGSLALGIKKPASEDTGIAALQFWLVYFKK